MVSAVLADNPFNGDRKMSNPFAHLTLPSDARVVEVDGRHYLVTQSVNRLVSGCIEHILRAWAPVSIGDCTFNLDMVTSHGSGMFWGQLGYECITPEIDALPRGSNERFAAVMAYYANKAAFAHRVIAVAFPEVASRCKCTRCEADRAQAVRSEGGAR